MSYSIIGGSPRHLIIHGDCDGEDQKRRAVIRGDFLAAPGPSVLDPSFFRDVDITLDQGVTKERVAELMEPIGVHEKVAELAGQLITQAASR